MAISKTSEIILGRVENIDSSHFNCCLSFSKASDLVNGINVRLSNMAGGYPFSFEGVTWRDSETLYLCGEFSDSSDKHLSIQEEMNRQTSGFAAKRFVKNADFANLLLQLPKDAIIIEDTTIQHCNTKEVWGCTNIELAARRAEVKKETIKQVKADNPKISKAALKRIVNIETCKVSGIGTFVGQNNLGKILMICRGCLVNGTEPPIDYALLESKDIHILGKRISFIH